jgi:hypothetical protein
MPICSECGRSFHANCKSCPFCQAENLPRKVKGLEKDLEQTKGALAENERKTDVALSTARKALREASNHRKQIAVSGGFVAAVLGGFGIIYQHTSQDFVLFGIWFCGILLCVLLVAFLLSFRDQRGRDTDNVQ